MLEGEMGLQFGFPQYNAPSKKDTPDFNHKTLKDLEKVLNIRN